MEITLPAIHNAIKINHISYHSYITIRIENNISITKQSNYMFSQHVLIRLRFMVGKVQKDSWLLSSVNIHTWATMGIPIITIHDIIFITFNTSLVAAGV